MTIPISGSRLPFTLCLSLLLAPTLSPADHAVLMKTLQKKASGMRLML